MLCLCDLSTLDAAGADAHSAGTAFHLGLDWAKVDAPPTPGNVVRMRDVIAELGAFAAKFTDLCHDETPKNLIFRAFSRPALMNSGGPGGGQG